MSDEIELLNDTEIPVPFTLADRKALHEVHAVISELKGLEGKLLPMLEGMQKNPMLKMLFK